MQLEGETESTIYQESFTVWHTAKLLELVVYTVYDILVLSFWLKLALFCSESTIPRWENKVAECVYSPFSLVMPNMDCKAINH